MTTTADPTTLQSAIPKSNPQDKSQSSSRKDQDQKHPEDYLGFKPPKPKLRLHVEALRHSASISFLTLVPDVPSTVDAALSNIVRYLYTSPSHAPSDNSATQKNKRPHFTPSIPSTRSVTIFLRDYSGVAYTTGTELDNDHKEIHLSLPYIQHCTSGSSAKADPIHELVGVLTHELVHCYQHTAPRSGDNGEKIPRPPGGLVEGIADFVRLKAGLEPPHWKRPQLAQERAPKWDAGYQHTAYFLAWIEDVRVGRGAIGMLNDRLLRTGYVGEEVSNCAGVGFWKGLFGIGVAELWDEYGHYLDGCDRGDGKTDGNWEEEILNPE